MKRRSGDVDQKNLTVEQTWTRHETQCRARYCLLGRSEQKIQKQKFVRPSFVVDPVADDRERSLLTQG